VKPKDKMDHICEAIIADENPRENYLFEVMVERSIGAVVSGGDLTPTAAAFVLIAETGEEGCFRFPDLDSDKMFEVTVAHLKHPTQ
jgi:hypothetical protein